MRKTGLVLSFFIFAQVSFAQLFSKEKILNNENFDKDFLSWGYFLGFNSYDFNFDYVEDREDILIEKSLSMSFHSHIYTMPPKVKSVVTQQPKQQQQQQQQQQ